MAQQTDQPDAPPTSDASARGLLARALLATGLRDRVAFRRVYDLSSAKLFGICLRICGERQAAEDVLQEVYLIVWRRAPSFEPSRASPITWLATIARNRAIDWRRANRPVLREAFPDDLPERADDAKMADAAMIDDEEVRRLRVCLAALDERPRRAIRSAFLDGFTYRELAARDGMPLPTMKSLVRRGLLQLRKCLNDDA
jgi:RNA polymerase sigma factor (sigma-70 family)